MRYIFEWTYNIDLNKNFSLFVGLKEFYTYQKWELLDQKMA